MSATDAQNAAPAAAPAVEEVEAKKKLSLKKSVKPEDFNGPKRFESAYFIYSSDERSGVMDKLKAASADGKLPLSDIAKKLGEMWKVLPEDQKKVYQDKATESKAVYEAEMEKWKLTKDYKDYCKANASHNKKKADKKAGDLAKASGMPKRPMSGYLLHGVEIQPEIKAQMAAEGKKFSIKDAAVIVKARWTALGEEGQKKYHDQYALEKAKYAEDLKAWNETDAGKAFLKSKETNKKRKRENEKVGRRAAKKAKKDSEKKEDGTAPDESVEDEEEDEEVEEEVVGEEEEVEEEGAEEEE